MKAKRRKSAVLILNEASLILNLIFAFNDSHRSIECRPGLARVAAATITMSKQTISVSIFNWGSYSELEKDIISFVNVYLASNLIGPRRLHLDQVNRLDEGVLSLTYRQTYPGNRRMLTVESDGASVNSILEFIG
jgi:hypothetical protein